MMFQRLNSDKNYFLITNFRDFFTQPLFNTQSKFFGYFKFIPELTQYNLNYDYHIVNIPIPFKSDRVYESYNTITLLSSQNFIKFELTNELKVEHNLPSLTLYLNLMPRYVFDPFKKDIKYNTNNQELTFIFENQFKLLAKLKVPIAKILGWRKVDFDYDVQRHSMPSQFWFLAVEIKEKQFSISLEELYINDKLVFKNTSYRDNLNFKPKSSNDLLDYALNKFLRFFDDKILPVAGFWWFDQFWFRDALWSFDAFEDQIKQNIIDFILKQYKEYKKPLSIADDPNTSSIDGILLFILHLIKANKRNDAIELLNLVTPYLNNNIILSPPKSTWTDTLNMQYAIEVNALWYEINRRLNNNNDHIFETIVKKFNENFDYNILLAYFVSDAFQDLFILSLEKLISDYSISNEHFFAITTESTKSKTYVPIHDGEIGKSYHRGDAWLWLTNLFAYNLVRLLKADKIGIKYFDIVKKIINLNMYYFNSGMLFSLPELTDSTFDQKGSLMQLWSVATFKLLRDLLM